jgi:ketosteroid isomerase-like protein
VVKRPHVRKNETFRFLAGKGYLPALIQNTKIMKKNIRLLPLFVLVAFAFSGCTPVEKTEPIDMAKLKAEIQAKEDAFAAGEKAKDADAVAAYYSEDAVSYNRNDKPVSGKAAIRDRIAKQIAADTTGHYNAYKLIDLFAEGNSALEIGSWTEYDAEGSEIENGYYMSYFEKHDGKYECVRDMTVTTKPASTMSEEEEM